MRAADDRLKASIISSSSIRCSLTGGHVGWMTKTSCPRMFSITWQYVSPSLNFLSVI
jgi:hypothetical protein